MAGFIIAIGTDDIERIRECAQYGVYSTFINVTSSGPFEGTLADYCSMNEGDNIYFFAKRKIYGVGVLKKVGTDCKYNNYYDSTKLVSSPWDAVVKSQLLFGKKKENLSNHWVCLFTPSPSFYLDGVDMDDLLAYKPQNLKRIRTFWKTSFIKVDDLENETIKEFIYLRNMASTSTVTFNDVIHKRIASKLNAGYIINPMDLIPYCLDSSGGCLRHEMALEAILVDALTNGKIDLFGKWDFVTHQVCASPFKPIDYMDKIDIFAYKFKVIEDSKVITKYLIIELKAKEANDDTVTQVSKYVDYVCKEFAFGDYSLIEAYVVANDISGIDTKKARVNASRSYNIGSHPIVAKQWCDLHLVKYEIVGGSINFTKTDI